MSKSIIKGKSSGSLGTSSKRNVTLSRISQLSMPSSISTVQLSTIQKIQTIIKTAPNLDDYSNFLYQNVPLKDDRFIGKIRYLLYMSFTGLQEAAKVFYASHQDVELINADKIHANYQDLVSEILPMYIYYDLQCEIVWLEESSDFIKKVNELLTGIKVHKEQSLDTYFTASLTSLQDRFEEIIAELSNIRSIDKTQFLAIHRKLKPLHGYPGNKAMLDELNQEVLDFVQLKSDEVSNVYSYQDDLQNMVSEYTNGLYEINDDLKELEMYCEENNLSANISMDFSDILMHIKMFVNTSAALVEDNILRNTLQKLDYYKKNIKIPSEYLLCVSACTFPFNSSIDLTVSRRNSEYVIQKVDEFERQKEDMFEKINSIVEENKETIDYWREMWNREVQHVISLYKVKYDIPGNI